MKKKIIFPVLCLMLLAFAFALVACAGDALNNVTVYTIRFDNNYDGSVVKQEVVAGEDFSLAQDPVRPGYNFAGWYLDSEEQTERFTAEYDLKDDITVFAKWEKDNTKSVVTYKYRNYGAADLEVAVENGGKITKPADPKFDENEMCEFLGWFSDEACTTAYDFTSNVVGDITLYAGWKQVKTIVKFDANYIGCDKPAQAVAEIGKAVARPADPVRARYEFGDWYTARIGGAVYDFSAIVNDELTLYAHWIRSEYTVTFDLNGGTAKGVDLSYDIKRGASAAEQAKAIEDALEYTGHVFKGWYIIKTDPDDEADAPAESDKADLGSITDDMRVYAAWDLEEYTVSFDYNYSGAPQAPADQKVKYGKNIAEPTVASRSGYVFVGWFTDKDGNTQFTLDMPVTATMTLYAKWVDSSEAGDNVTVTYYYILEGKQTEYKKVSIAFGGTAESNLPQDPTVDEYIFAGWYTTDKLEIEFNVKANLTADTSVYGKMLKRYTFEAEMTDLTGKYGKGTSSEYFEEQLIINKNYVTGGTVSNDYFVRALYYNGASLEFEVNAEKEVDDAIIYLRVSSEGYLFQTNKEENGKTYNILSDEELQIFVTDESGNSVQIKYGELVMPYDPDKSEADLEPKAPFEDCFIAAKVHLSAGVNKIELYVNNNNSHGGTFGAEAPMVDCMYIYSSVKLSLLRDYEFYKRDGVIK